MKPLKEYTRVHDDIQTEGAAGIEARAQTEAAAESHEAGPSKDRIGVGGSDENVAKIQLAARWAEQYPPVDDTLEDALRRFKRVYHYVDSVTKQVDPPDA